MQDYQKEVDRIQNAFKAEMEAYEAQADIYAEEMEQYQKDLSEWEIERNGAVSSAEGLIETVYDNFQSIPYVPQPPDSAEGTSPEQKQTLAVLESAEGQVKQESMARFTERKELFNESNKDFPKGLTPMVAITQAGKVTCTFSNAWLFLIEQ